MANEIYLTKSRYTAGLQCLRRLWLNVHDPTDWEEPELGSGEDIGLEIGRMVRQLFLAASSLRRSLGKMGECNGSPLAKGRKSLSNMRCRLKRSTQHTR
jgi:hypothetical protein